MEEYESKIKELEQQLEIEKQLRKEYEEENELLRSKMPTFSVQERVQERKKIVFKPSKLTQKGIAELFTEYYGQDSFKYVADEDRFIFWERGWKNESETEDSHEQIAKLTDKIRQQAEKEQFTDVEFYKYAMAEKLQSASYIEEIVKSLKHVRAIRINSNDLDTNPSLIGGKNYYINLEDGKITLPKQNFYVTKQSNLDPNENGKEEWLKFINEITSKDEDFAHYLQVLLGSALYGETTQEIYILLGGGGNGKSCLLNVISNILGDYSGAVDIEDLNKNRFAMANFEKKRFMVVNEIERNGTLSEKQLKKIASNEDLLIEQKFKQQRRIKPTHKLFISTNNLPRITATDNGTWRRIRVLPFRAKIQNVIVNYEKKLAERCEGYITRWLLAGVKEYIANGYELPYCRAVEVASENFRGNANFIDEYLEEKCESSKKCTAFEKAEDLYNNYCDYVKNEMQEKVALNSRQFYAELRRRCYKVEPRTGNKLYVEGIKIIKEGD